MKYFKLAFLSFADKLKINMILVLQLTAVFVLVNVLIASINSRDMLYEPYKNILDKQGWYLAYIDLDRHGNGAEDLFEDSHDKPKVLTIKETFGNDRSGNYFRISVMPNELFENLHLPAASSVRSADGRVYAFSASKLLRAGNKVSIDLGADTSIDNIIITDILTDPTYYPSYNRWKTDDDISMLYRKISSETEKDNFLIMSDVTAQKLGISENNLSHPNNSMVYFPDSIEKEQFNAEEKRLEEESNVALISFDELRERTEKLLADDYRRYAPLGVISVIVVLIGTAGAIAVQTLKEIKSYAVLYLCGMKWRRIVLISLCKVLIMLAAAVLISGSVMVIMQRSSIAASFGLAFNSTNLYASLALVGLTVLSSVALPFILLRRSEPAEVMRRMKND